MAEPSRDVCPHCNKRFKKLRITVEEIYDATAEFDEDLEDVYCYKEDREINVISVTCGFCGDELMYDEVPEVLRKKLV